MRTLLVVPVFSCALLLLLTPAAWAAPPTEGTGTRTFVSHTQKLIRTHDGNSTYAAVDQTILAGAISGSPVDTYTFTVHSNGLVTGHGTETCTPCTIAGRTGSYSVAFTFTSDATFTRLQGRFTFLSGSGGLTGLHGHGTFTSSTFSVSYQFEPGPRHDR